jgi:hypothetical protein
MRSSTKSPSPWFTLFKTVGFLLSGGSTLLGLVLLVGLWRMGDGFLTKVTALFSGAKAEPKVDVRSVVIKQVQDASELTTAIFTMEAVVPTQQDAALGRFVFGTTKLLYIAHGQVRAGVDLSQLKPESITVAGDRLFLRLPAPKILDSKVDVNRSSVYDYNRGTLGLGPDVGTNLQTLAQQKALLKIVETACSEGILARANDRAKFVVGQLVKVPPYREIVIETQATGECRPVPESPAVSASPVPNPPAANPGPNPAPNPASLSAPVTPPQGLFNPPDSTPTVPLPAPSLVPLRP